VLADLTRAQAAEAMPATAFDRIFERVVEQSGVLAGLKGRYTSHCTRRGGAQHRFMFAKRRWILTNLKWWGGWAPGESVRLSRPRPLTDLSARSAL
jgi:hypothetical protein